MSGEMPGWGSISGEVYTQADVKSIVNVWNAVDCVS